MICTKHKHSSEKTARRCFWKEYYRHARRIQRLYGVSPGELQAAREQALKRNSVETVQRGWITLYVFH